MEKKLYKFYADWCGPCRMMKPVAARLADEAGLELIEVDIDQNAELANEFDVANIPTLILVEDGEEKSRYVGMNTQARLASALGL